MRCVPGADTGRPVTTGVLAHQRRHPNRARCSRPHRPVGRGRSVEPLCRARLPPVLGSWCADDPHSGLPTSSSATRPRATRSADVDKRVCRLRWDDRYGDAGDGRPEGGEHPLLRTRSSGNPEIYGRNAASRRESYTRERSGGSLMSTDPAAKNVGARPVPVSPLDAAAAAGDPIEWPKDPENDPPDTPVVVLAVQDDESTYQPFPDSRLEPRPGLIASLQRTGSRRPDRAHPGRPPTCPTRRSAGRRSHVRTGNGPSTGMARRAARGARNARPLVPPGCAAPAACFALCVRDARTLASGYFFSQPGFRGLPQPVTTMSVRSQQAHWAAKPSDAFTAPR
jgi:hypothetical protein